MKKKQITKSILAILFTFTTLACSNDQIPTQTDEIIEQSQEDEQIDDFSDVSEETEVIKHISLKKEFIELVNKRFDELSYYGYVALIKEGNLFRIIHMNEVLKSNDVDIKLHYKNLWLDLKTNEINEDDSKELQTDDKEFFDLNEQKLSILFSGKCQEEYKNEIVKDIEQYFAYDFFKITKTGYKIVINYGGKEYNKNTKDIEEQFYQTEYLLELDECEKDVTLIPEKVRIPALDKTEEKELDLNPDKN